MLFLVNHSLSVANFADLSVDLTDFRLVRGLLFVLYPFVSKFYSTLFISNNGKSRIFQHEFLL